MPTVTDLPSTTPELWTVPEPSELEQAPEQHILDPFGLTNQTGCRVLADLYGGEFSSVELVRTGTGSWFSRKELRGRFHHRSSDLKLLQVLSTVDS